jgi:hypothetical protein
MAASDLDRQLADLEPLRRRAARSSAVRIATLSAIAVVTFGLCVAAALAAPVLAGPWLRGSVVLVFILFAAAPALVLIIAVLIGRRVNKALGHAASNHYKEQFAAQVIQPLLDDAMPSGRVRVGEVVDRGVFVRSELFDPPSLYGGTARVDGAIEGRPFTAGAVDAQMVVDRYGTSGQEQAPILTGFFAFVDVPKRAATTVLVVHPDYFSERRSYRRRNLVRGRTDDEEFNREFVVCVHQDERAVPTLSSSHRTTLRDLQQAAGTPLLFAFGPHGIAVAASTGFNQPFEARVIRANDADELRRHARLLTTIVGGLPRLATLPALSPVTA